MNITKVFFNPATDACEPFSYSGCGGNANNFMSVAQCEAKCVKKPSTSVKDFIAENTQVAFEEKGAAVEETPKTEGVVPAVAKVFRSFFWLWFSHLRCLE